MNTQDEHITDEEIHAFVDGELDAPEAARIEAAMAADVMVAARVERERRLKAHVRGAYESALVEPVPARLLEPLSRPPGAAAARSDTVVELPSRRTERAIPRRRIPPWAIAASIAVVAGVVWMRSGQAPIDADSDGLVARGALADALERGLASEPVGDTRIGLTFRDPNGRLCRTFSDARLAGLACRQGDQWRVETVAAAPKAAGELRQASTAVPPEVQAAVDVRLQGDVFDAAQERAARDSGWRVRPEG